MARRLEDACDACHTLPADGSTGETSVRKTTRTMPDEDCDPLSGVGGENLRIQATPALAAFGQGRVAPPEDATHTALFTIPFVFGPGIVDAIPVTALEALADSDDRDGDGISGRLGRDVLRAVTDIARFLAPPARPSPPRKPAATPRPAAP